MSEPMFFCALLPPTGGIVLLAGEEARHALASRRLRVGDELRLFDGCGGVAEARIRALGARGRELELEVAAPRRQEAPCPTLHLACALPKGDRAAVLLDMTTQLGIASFTPLLCERSVVDPGAGTLERLRRVCLEACKQSRRAHLPEIRAPKKIGELLAAPGKKWLAHPDGQAHGTLTPADPLTLLIGPEGGFSTDEVALAQTHGAARVMLGSGILRVETAAVALVAALRIGA